MEHEAVTRKIPVKDYVLVSIWVAVGGMFGAIVGFIGGVVAIPMGMDNVGPIIVMGGIIGGISGLMMLTHHPMWVSLADFIVVVLVFFTVATMISMVVGIPMSVVGGICSCDPLRGIVYGIFLLGLLFMATTMIVFVVFLIAHFLSLRQPITVLSEEP